MATGDKTRWQNMTMDVETLKIGGTAITATSAEMNYLDIATLGTGAASKAVVLDAGEDYTWPATGRLTYGGTAITATGAEINYLDITTLGTGAASKAVVLDANGDYTWPASGVLSLGGTATDGTVGGAGSSGSEIELGATAGTALNFRFRSSHTTGDARGMYLRLDFDGAGGSGEALRAFTEIENVTVATGGTVNAAHITMEIDGNSGQVSGAGNVIRATLGGSGTKTLGGTLSGINLHLDLPTAVTLPADLPALRLTKTQDHEWTTFAAFDSIVGTGNAVEAATSAMSTNATAWAIHITVDGADGYIPVYDNKTWA